MYLETIDEAVAKIKYLIEKSIVDGGVEAKNNLIWKNRGMLLQHLVRTR